MIMLSKSSNFPDELSENDELSEYELSGSDCIEDQTRSSTKLYIFTIIIHMNMGTKPGWNLWHGHGERTWEHKGQREP